MTAAKQNSTTEPEVRVGAYVCYCGGNISDAVDVEKVCERVRTIPGVVVARSNMFMCSDPGQELILEDLKSGLVNRVVVASCSPSLHEDTFRRTLARAGANPYVYEHANLREQVSWVHHGQEATDKATRLVAAAVGKARMLTSLEPIRVEACRHATVIGGGVAGLRCALDLAERGIPVALLEKSPFLGGQAAHLDRLAPSGDAAAGLIIALSDAVRAHPDIRLYPCSRVEAFEGYLGNFTLKVVRTPPAAADETEKLDKARLLGKKPGEFIPLEGVLPAEVPRTPEALELNTGVIVLATGFKTYMPRPGEYGFGDFPEVVTLPDLIRILAEDQGGGETLVIGGRPIRQMAMIHCVGSRQIPGIHEENEGGYLNEYCSRVCCSATLQAANLIRETYPRTRIFDFYRDIRTYGRGHEELYTRAAHNKVLFCRFEVDEPPQVRINPQPAEYPLGVSVKDVLTFGEEVEVPVDLVVLAVGMEANDIIELVHLMKLPVGADRFLQEVHPKLRPVELSAAGILLAGTCQAPFDIGESCAAASGAAVKAAAILSRGYVELDPFVAEVDLDKCRGSAACVAACLSEGALTLVEREVNGQKVQRAEVNPALCLGCGACVAVCPENAINVKGWALKQYEAMVDLIVKDDYLAVEEAEAAMARGGA
jgi:heterodisulfide reductase subunit A